MKLLLIFFGIVSCTTAVQVRMVKNERPIIGVLAQEIYNGTNPPSVSYIAASYVKYVEGAGARVAPIFVDQDEVYLRKMFNSINGLLIPGGAIIFDFDNGTVNNSTRGFVKSGLFLLNLAKEANDKGDFFPVWGTCLGFEFMLFAEGNGEEIRTRCQANNQLDKLRFQKDTLQSRLFGRARKSVLYALSSLPITINFHHYCLTPENFVKFQLNRFYKLLATSYDPVANVTYVSAVEGVNYPFFGVQFHPEKNIYEWTPQQIIPHSSEAVETAQYFAAFFVDQARQNTHSFPSPDEESSALIYNYVPTYTAPRMSSFTQSYFFPF